jgi:hypothetical protein
MGVPLLFGDPFQYMPGYIDWYFYIYFLYTLFKKMLKMTERFESF